MWVLFAREPPPDAPYWRGRRSLAALDASVWPALWICVVIHLPAAGIFGPMACAIALFAAVRRLRVALWCNHRYRFTTWRWIRVLASLLLLGGSLKWLLLSGIKTVI